MSGLSNRFLIVLLLAALLAVPVVGQGVEVAPDQEAIVLSETVLIVATFVAALVIAVFGGMVIALYRSLPPTAQTLFEAVLPPLVQLVEKQTDLTRTQIDDTALQEIKRWLIEQGVLSVPEKAAQFDPDPLSRDSRPPDTRS